MSTDAMPTLQWFLLQCKAQQMTRAQLHLQNQGFEFYVPMHKVHHLVCGRGRPRLNTSRLEIRSEPLFPGYLFIHLSEESNWRALYATRGISRLVSFNGRPHPVSDELIGGLRLRFGDDCPPEQLYKVGERVLVTDGCFRHIEAIVKAVTADERVVVLMNIMHSKQEVIFEPTQLAKTG